ncbi:uncharacterized protein DEA37_0006055 [Paragonimus westermani]|uniref:Uncharacterized protein n=1 Tax=Paragonimus westermani TaxID=34504 RepID=A0A5J4NX96_9TREM|nr:uncharacterized protein DEA37_0006055 [Paragonimus westermani]
MVGQNSANYAKDSFWINAIVLVAMIVTGKFKDDAAGQRDRAHFCLYVTTRVDDSEFHDGAQLTGSLERVISDKLISRVKEHLPNWVQNSVLRKNDDVVETRKQPASAVTRHVLTTGHVIDPICASRILLRHSNPRFLRFAEAVAINRMKPTLCVQKQLLVNLTLPWT